MPDALSATLSPPERKATADRLWKIIGMIDRGATPSAIREAVKHTVQEIEPWLAEYSKDRPVNLEAA